MKVNKSLLVSALGNAAVAVEQNIQQFKARNMVEFARMSQALVESFDELRRAIEAGEQTIEVQDEFSSDQEADPAAVEKPPEWQAILPGPLGRGDQVRALMDLDVQEEMGQTGVPAGTIGVVFEPANHYGDSYGPMVRWHNGHACNVYPELGQVERVWRAR